MKKLYINYELLKENPLKSDEVHPIIIDDKKLWNLKNELTHGSDTSYMVSGYRGSGKTSYINKLESLVEKEGGKTLFIRMNFVSGQEKTNILRGMIRSLANKYFNEIAKSPEEKGRKNFLKIIVSKFKREQKSEEYSFLELLYRRTFEDVSNTEAFTISTTNVRTRKIDLTISLVIIFGGILTLLNKLFSFITKDQLLTLFEFITKHGLERLAVSFFSVILPFWLFIRIFREWKSERKLAYEFNSKTLYDDEIAEYHLKQAIELVGQSEMADQKGNNSGKVKLVFVIDELDKIEDEKSLKVLLGQLKPLMLEGNATFLIIGGQKLYYMYENEQLVDDSLLASLFSKNIHVPLPQLDDFISYISHLIKNTNSKDLDESLIKQYTKVLILKSNRSIRSFISLVKQSIEWDIDTNKAYIPLRESRLTMLQSEILDCMESVLKNNIVEDDEGSNDFLITQLHIVIKSMQLEPGGFNTKSLITKVEGYPDWYWGRLSTLIDLLLIKMVKEDLLEFENNSKGEKIFNWKKEIVIFFNPEFRVTAKSFNTLYESLSRMLIGACKEVTAGKREFSFMESYERLVKKGLSSTDEFEALIKRYNSINEFLTKGTGYMTTSEIRRLQTIERRTLLLGTFFKEYTKMNLRHFISDYTIVSEYVISDTAIDILAVHPDREDIIFNVQYYPSIQIPRVKILLDTQRKVRIEYEASKRKACKFISVIYLRMDGPLEQLEEIRKSINELDTDNSIILLNAYRDIDSLTLSKAILNSIK